MENENYSPGGGKLYKSDGSIVYLSDIIDTLIITEDTEITAYSKRHQMIHKGCFYSTTKIFTLDEEGKYIIAGLTGKNCSIHMIPPIVKTSGPNVEIRAYENPIILTTGELLDIQNHNRQSTRESTFQWLKNGVTVSDSGNKFYEDFIPGAVGIGGSASGDNSLEIQEWILKKDKVFSLEILNLENETDKCWLLLQWYEYED